MESNQPSHDPFLNSTFLVATLKKVCNPFLLKRLVKNGKLSAVSEKGCRFSTYAMNYFFESYLAIKCFRFEGWFGLGISYEICQSNIASNFWSNLFNPTSLLQKKLRKPSTFEFKQPNFRQKTETALKLYVHSCSKMVLEKRVGEMLSELIIIIIMN